MTLLIAGLLLFLGTHSLRIVAVPWRARRIAQLGEGPWKGIYSVVSLAGFALIVWGYGVARGAPVIVWTPPTWTRHLASLLTLPAFVLLAAAYVPGNRIMAAIHPRGRRAFRRLPALGDRLYRRRAAPRPRRRHGAAGGHRGAHAGRGGCRHRGLGRVRLPAAWPADRRAAVRLPAPGSRRTADGFRTVRAAAVGADWTRSASGASAGRIVPPNERGLGVVFQDYAVWPQMSVADNVG